AVDRHRILREDRGSVKKGSMVLAAVETVTKADPVRESRRLDSDVAAQAPAGEVVHAGSPLSLEPHPGRSSDHERHHRSLVDRSGDITNERSAARPQVA